MKKSTEELGDALAGAAISSLVLFFLSWIFFRLLMATEDAFLDTDSFTKLRVLVLAGWVTAIFFMYHLAFAVMAFKRKQRE